MHVSYYYKKVKIPTYIYNGGEGEEALFFSFFFLCLCIYERQEYSQNRLNLVSILTYLLSFIYEYKKNNKKKKQLPSFRSTSSHLSTSWLNCFKSFHKK